MSRGLGRVQRALLVALQDNERNGERPADGLTAAELASVVYSHGRRGVGWTGWHRAYLMEEAEMSAVRRALTTLAGDGLVHQCKGPSGQYSARWRRGEKAAERGEE